MRIEGVKVKTFRSFDGTRITYQDVGEGPVLVFANGLGGTFEAWIHLVNHLKDRYRILSWDYRGLYASERPDLRNLSIVDHVRDMEILLKLEGVKNALLVGWSMGTQVVFEFYKRNPDVADGLVIICGAAGRPFDTALNFAPSRYILPVAFRLLKKVHRLQSAVIKSVIRIPRSLDLMKVIGMLAKDGDLETFKHMASDYADLDFEAYNQIMLGLGDHDARDVLPTIAVPTLIFTADQDFFTPDYVSEQMADSIPDSRIVALEGAGHYAPLEFPDRFNREVDAFIAGRIEPALAARAKKKAKAARPVAAKKTAGKAKPRARAKKRTRK